jgi:hypothetical protein
MTVGALRSSFAPSRKHIGRCLISDALLAMARDESLKRQAAHRNSHIKHDIGINNRIPDNETI